jgi:mono/diheme cytochrome c family protein
MKRMTLAIATILLGAVVSSGASAATQLVVGKSEYRNACAVCHGLDGKASSFIDQLKKAPGNLTMLAKANGGKFPEERVAAMIDGRELVKAHGDRDMPAWGDRYSKDKVRAAEYYCDMPYMDTEAFVQNRINALLAYLKSIQVK